MKQKNTDCRIIAICNLKGGVGTTTTCVNLGVGLAKAGKKVLLVDADPNADLTISLGWPRPDKIPFTLATAMTKILMGNPSDFDEGILRHAENIDWIPANIQLSSLKAELVNAKNRTSILRMYLDSLRDRYTHILIDCEQSMDLLTVNALTAADYLVIPVQAGYLPAKGLEQTIITFAKTQQNLNPYLKICGVLMTMVDKRTNFGREISELIRSTYGSDIKVFDSEIPYSVRAQEASVEGKSIFAYDSGGKVAEAYIRLTREILEAEK